MNTCLRLLGFPKATDTANRLYKQTKKSLPDIVGACFFLVCWHCHIGHTKTACRHVRHKHAYEAIMLRTILEALPADNSVSIMFAVNTLV